MLERNNERPRRTYRAYVVRKGKETRYIIEAKGIIAVSDG
jgi:hypothetical protein